MKKILSFFIAILAICFTQAQNPTNSGNLADGFKIMRGESKGTPFLTEKWHVGYGVFEDGSTTRPQQMNYDIHGNNLVYKFGESNQVMKLLDNGFTGFILKAENEDLIFAKIDGDKFKRSKKEDKYYRIIKAPSRTAIIEYKKEFKDPNASGWTSSNDNTLNSEYESKEDYYVLNGNQKYEKVKLKKNSLLKVYKDKKKKMQNYIASNNINFESIEDLVSTAEYYHSL